MLDSDDLWRGGQVPALSATQAEAAKQFLEEYRSIPTAMSKRDFAMFMGKISVAYPTQRVTDDEAALRIEVYGEQLRDIPIDMLEAARSAATQRIKFFPTIAELRELAYSLPRPPRIRRQRRLARMVEAYEASAAAAPPPDLVDPSEVTALLGRLDIAIDRSEPRKKAKPVGGVAPKKPMPAVADYVALGLTPDEAREMVEMQARAA